MSTLNTQLPSLLDHIKRMDPDGAIAQIVETLSQRNAFLADAVFKEGNLPTGHQFTSRTALPSVGWRRFNEGIAPSKSRTGQTTEACGMLTGLSVVDADEAKLNGNEVEFRASEDKGFVQSMNNEVETGFAYHSTKTNPEKFMGFVPRLDATSGNPAAAQIIKHDAAAAGSDQTSILLVAWSPETAFGIFPKGSKVGIEAKDMGSQLWDDGSGKKFEAYVTKWTWKLGLCVKDWRYVVRIANIDATNLSTTGNDLIKSMVKAYHQLYDTKTGRLAFYCNRAIGTYLHLQAMDSVKNSTLSIESVGGHPVTTLLGVPVRETDAILSTEAVVS